MNGLVGAGYFALGAVGLTLVYGVLRAGQFRPWRYADIRRLCHHGLSRSLGVPFWPAAMRWA